MKPHKFDFQAAYCDTDAYGIMYHARYIEIAERARMDMLKNIKDPDGGFVVNQVHAKYKQPLRAGDMFGVKTTITGCSAASANIEQQFIKDGNIHAIVNVELAYVKNGASNCSRIPDFWLKALGIKRTPRKKERTK
jgi:acyl-CoA thioester hydrolase